MSISLVKEQKGHESSMLDASTPPSLYAQYILEHTNKHIIENDKGFATYLFLPDAIYAEDVYVKPEFRNTAVASGFGDQIAQIGRAAGYTKMYGSVRPNANNSTASLKFLLAYGFTLLEAGPNSIVLVKEL